MDNLDRYEERFLVKWNDLSHLHCSWETEKDLVEFCDGAKGRLSTFFRKSVGGLLYDADERLDGVSCGCTCSCLVCYWALIFMSQFA